MPIIQHLIVEERGAFVGKTQGRLTVFVGKERRVQAPLLHLESVLLIGEGISISTDALAACSEEGIAVHLVDAHGHPYAALHAAGLVGTVRTRRTQYAAYHDGRGLVLARALARAKLQNQAGLLRYMAKYRKESEPERYAAIREAMTETLAHEAEVGRVAREATTLEELREPLMALEGRAAQAYWRGFALLLPEGVPWPGRSGRGSVDPVNSLLNYGYGILYGQVEKAVLLAGLDSYAGFVHADRPGKYSLVLDLIEPFRQPVVDRAVLNFLGKGGTVGQDERGLLDAATRRTFAERVLDRLERATPHEGKQVPLRHLVQGQARGLASFLRGERAAFEPFVARW